MFAVFFILVTLTGYFQVRIIQKNIEELLKSEGETLFKHVKREIDINLDYLNLLEKSPSLITPSLLNVMTYDEAVVDDLFNLVTNATNIEATPFSNLVVVDKSGKRVIEKGKLHIQPSDVRRLLSGRQETVVRMPSGEIKSLFMGVRVGDRAVFLSLNQKELEMMRQKVVVKGIIEREEKGFNIVGVSIFDGKGMPYAVLDGKEDDAFVVRKPLDSKFLPDYRIEIFVSKGPATDILRRTTLSFVLILVILIISGALSVYIIYLLQRKYERRMTEIEREMALKERLVSLGRLASGMAHEIRNPLNAISISVQRLKREFTPEPEKRGEYNSFTDIIRNELQRVDRIVEEFLLSARAQAPFLKENLYAIMDEVITIISEKAQSRDIRIHNGMDRSIEAEVQKERLKQAFYNIILNGIEAIGADGLIEISSTSTGRNIELSIKDSGTGIKEEELHRIFEYYFTTKDKGMGLGLPISYMIVKDHGGDIKVFSEQRRGTTFTITLPMNAPSEMVTNNSKLAP